MTTPAIDAGKEQVEGAVNTESRPRLSRLQVAALIAIWVFLMGFAIFVLVLYSNPVPEGH